MFVASKSAKVVVVLVLTSRKNEVVVSVMLVTTVDPVKSVVVSVSVTVIVVRDVMVVMVSVSVVALVVLEIEVDSVNVGHVCGNESAGKSSMFGKPGVLAGTAWKRMKYNCGVQPAVR
jgi:hypothetical protein